MFIKSEYASITVQALMDMAEDLTKRTETGHFDLEVWSHVTCELSINLHGKPLIRLSE